ncbi:MAG: hypothetical protein ABSA46_06775 [Thermodesulfovibrionales bacterium]
MGKKLDRNNLGRSISGLLKAEPTSVIATCRKNMPRSSTVEFSPSDTTIYILTEYGEKLTALANAIADGKLIVNPQ